jgi:hypothetical protein
MNKKGVEPIITTIIIVLLAIVSIGVIWAILHQIFQEPQFKITKQVCKEDNINLESNMICRSSCLYGLTSALQVTDQNTTTFLQRQELLNECNSFCERKVPTTGTTCYEEEVSQTEMYNSLFDTDADTVNNLNLEFLNDEAKCIEGFFSWNMICDTIGNCQNSTVLEDCSKWQLGNFTIEVIR